MKVYELRNLLLEYSPDADVLVYVPETKTLDDIKSHNPNGRNCVQLNLSDDCECTTTQRPQLEEGPGKIAIFWRAGGGLQYLADAATPKESMALFDKEIGVDCEEEGILALCKKAVFYTVAPEAPLEHWHADTSWDDMSEFLKRIQE